MGFMIFLKFLAGSGMLIFAFFIIRASWNAFCGIFDPPPAETQQRQHHNENIDAVSFSHWYRQNVANRYVQQVEKRSNFPHHD